MRWFWALLLLAMIASGVLMLRNNRAPTPTPPAEADGAMPAPRPSRPRPAEQAPPADASRSPTDARESAATPSVADARPPKPVSSLPTAPDSATAAAPTAQSAQTPAPATPEPDTPKPAAVATDADRKSLEHALDAALGIKGEGSPAVPGADPPEPTAKPAAGAEPQPTAAAAAPIADPAKAKLVERPDGSVLVDDKYIIKGKGTESDPFVVTWEMLVSAKETYQPRLGRKVIPERLQMISGKWVRISGFIAFPLMAQSQDEMLMMLNQWDGCCIGVPPEPYDAIEVKLKTAVLGDDRMRVSGSVKGILRVDPYLIKDWLVSLYLMDDAELFKDEKAAVRAPGMHKGGAAAPEAEEPN
ncbi:MAG: hypothetical protein ACK4WH_14340 [Phycisphaerales bacterium]